MTLASLSRYLRDDREKRLAIDRVLFPPIEHKSLHMELSSDYSLEKAHVFYSIGIPKTKYCPKCLRKYEEEENFCFKCDCSLKRLSEMKNPREIMTKPKFTFRGSNKFESFDEIFTDENVTRINEFRFSIEDFKKITAYIRRRALRNMDNIAKKNEIIIDDLKTEDKVLLFAKSFVNVDFKSYGAELGHFEFDKITVDDRQTNSLLITTLIHELSHFILKEIIVGAICRVLDCKKSSLIEAIALYTLIFSPFTQLIDEYAAHTVEGRFTLYGYQDYSSFLSIEKSLDGEMSREEIEMTKTIGNTFSIAIKRILESFLDSDMRSDIKDQFLKDTMDRPNYEMLKMENCNVLEDEGLIKAMYLMISEGFYASAENVGKLIEYEKCF